MSSSRLELVIDSRQAQRELDRLEGRLHGVERASDRTERSMQSLTGSISSIRTVAMAAGGWFAAMGVSSFGRDVFNTVAGIEKMRASLVTMTGSVEGANEAWEQMREFAKTTPFELEQSVQAFIRMKGMGLDPTEESMRAFANTAAATGKDLMQMVEAVADAATGEYERLKEFNIKSSAQGDEVAFTFQGVTTTIKNSSEEIVRYLENIGNTTFSGAAIAQVDTLGGKLNNLGDRVDTLYAAIGEAGATDLFNAALDGSAEAVDFLTNNVENLARGVDLLSDAAIIAAGIYTGRFVAGMAAGTLSLANKTKASIADARATATATAAEIAFLKSVQGSLSAQLASSRSAVQRASLRKQLAANTAALTAANNTYTASLGRSTVAARAMGAASRGAAGAITLMGGPLGLLVGVGGLLYTFREELGLVRSAAEPTTQRIDNLTDALNRNSVAAVEAGIVNLSAEYFTLGQRAAAATAEIERLTAAQENDRQGAQARLQNNMRLRDLREELAQVTTEQEAAGKAATQLRETLAGLGETVVPTTNSLTDLDDTTLSLTDSIDKAADKTTTLADAYESLLDRIQPNRREARQYAQDLGTLNLALATGRMTTVQYMQAMGMLQESFQAAQRDTTDLADNVDAESDRMATLWERRLERMDDAGVDMWRSFLDGSEDAFGSFRRLALDTLAEVIHAYTTQRITASLGLNVAGGGASGGGLSFNGIGSLINGGKSLLGIGSSAAAPSLAMQGGLSSAALASASQVAGGAAYSGWAGSAASGAALGNVASGGIMSSITAGVSAAMPWIAGGLAIDSLLGGGITKAISGLFGGGKTAPKFELATVGQDVDPGRRGLFENYGEGVYSRGALGTVGFYDPNTARLEETFDGFDNAKAFLDGITALDNAMVGAVANLDNGAEKTQAMANAAQAVRLNAGDAAGIANQLATRTLAVVDVLDVDFSASLRGLGLDAEQLTGRVVQAANAMQLLDASSDRLNLQFDASAAGALRAADSIAQIAGGVEQLASLQDGYYQAYFSDAERAANLQRELTQALAEMGYALPSTRDGFRALVEQQNQLTESGQRNYVQLLQLAGAFDQMQTMLANAGSGVDSFADQLSRLNDEIGSLENDVRQAYQAFERQAFDQQVQLLGMMGDEQAALALQRERELLSIDPLLHETQRFIWAMEDEAAAKERVTQAAQNYRQEIERVRDQLGTALGGINQWIDQRNATGQTPGLNLEAAGEQFARQLVLAESGDRNALQSITQYADQYLAAGEAMFASGGAFQSIQQEVLSALQSLPEQISSEEYLAQEIRDALQSVVISEMPTDERLAVQLSNELTRLDANQLTAAQVRSALAPHATDAEISRLIREVDANGDGIITTQELANQRLAGLASGIGSALKPMFDSIDLDASGLINWQEFYSVFAGMASDEELRRIFAKLDEDGSGTISRLEALNRTSEGTEGNTQTLEERARDQLSELGGLVSEMTRSTGQFVALNQSIVSLDGTLKRMEETQDEIAELQYFSARQSSAQWLMSEIEKSAGIIARASDQLSAQQQAVYDRFVTNNAAQGSTGAMDQEDWQRIRGNVLNNQNLSSDARDYILHRAATMLRESQIGDWEKEVAGHQYSPNSFFVNGSHATGLWNVPFDNYIAEPHRDEMVVPAQTAGRLRELPSRELPMPALPNFPLLNRTDQHDVVRDLLNENKQLRKELNARLDKIEKHSAAAVAVQQAGFNGQINEQKKSNLALDDMSAAARLEASR